MHVSDDFNVMDSCFWFGFLVSLPYGIIHIFNPSKLAASWGIADNSWHDETQDFVQLLGVWILFQSMVAAFIPLFVHDSDTKLAFTWLHVLKNLAAFIVRYRMYTSGRDNLNVLTNSPTNGFLMSMLGDLFFTLLYGACAIYISLQTGKKMSNEKNKAT